MNVLLLVLWVLAIVAGCVLPFWLGWRDQRRERSRRAAVDQYQARFAQIMAEGERQRVSFIEPIDEADPFCTCPKCHLLGTHEIRWEIYRRPKIYIDDGDCIDVSGFGQPRDGTKETIRTCRFCGHTWRTSYPLTERETA